ncbi:hypothetical protein AFLA_012696 [Aspergillus flavus NRRL3357]|nr:hypothetical protein AFLA_012696 [Aspergillus flavus NRRL3357]
MSQPDSSTTGEVSPESQKTELAAPKTKKKKPAAKAKKLVQCAACTEPIERRATLKALCSHSYCYPCMSTFFESTLDGSSYFWPPRCCFEEIPLWLASACLSQDTTKRFKDKMTELKDTNKTYCSNPDCALYLAPSRCRDRFRTISQIGGEEKKEELSPMSPYAATRPGL